MTPPTQPTPTAADRNAAEECAKFFNWHDYREFDPALTLIIARHQQPYRDAVEKARVFLEQIKDHPTLWRNPRGPGGQDQYAGMPRAIPLLDAALAALSAAATGTGTEKEEGT